MSVDVRDEVLVGDDAEPGIWSASGSVVFRARIDTRAVPWKAPKTTRYGGVPLRLQSKSYRHWKDWSNWMIVLLKWAAGEQGIRRPFPAGYGLDLDMLFVLEPGGTPPDRMNCGKSVEDLMQGIVYDNDRDVRGGDVRRVFIGDRVMLGHGSRWEGPDRIHIRVSAVG